MTKMIFADLPIVTRVSSLGMFFVGWVLIAEFVIDRHGWDRWLPYYRVGNLCPYDALVVVVLAGAWVALHRRVKPAA